jgi:anti-sigma factor RsiW
MNLDEREESVDARALELQRYVDGELDPASRTAFEARLRAEPELRAECEALRGLRAMLTRAAQGAAPKLSPGFRDRVLAKALVTRDEPAVDLPAAGAAVHSLTQRCVRRAAIAAAVIAVLSLVVLSGILRRPDCGRLEASEADVQRAMADLDARMRGEVPAGGTERR